MKLIFIIFFFGVIKIFAQYDPQYSQYMFFNQSFNPGYAGTNDSTFSATILHRNQWVKLTGNPKIFSFFANTPVKALHGSCGIFARNLQFGDFDFTNVGLNYSYNTPVGKKGLLGIGIQGDVIHTVVTNEWHDNLGNYITGPNSINTNFNFNLGLFYSTPKYYVGLSTTNILPSQYYSFQSFSYRVSKIYYLTSGYNYTLSRKINIIPSILIKGDVLLSYVVDANFLFQYNNLFWVGATYRYQSADAIVAMAGFNFQIKQKSTLKIGYAYDISDSEFRAYHNNTHEVFLNYVFKLKKK